MVNGVNGRYAPCLHSYHHPHPHSIWLVENVSKLNAMAFRDLNR